MTTHEITISKARKAAKQISRNDGVTHQQALDRLAQEAGHGTWATWLRSESGPDADIPTGTTAASVLMALGWSVRPQRQSWCVYKENGRGGPSAVLREGVPIENKDVMQAIRHGLQNPAIKAFAMRDAQLVTSPPLRKSDKDVFLTLGMSDYHFEARLSADGPYLSCYDRQDFSRDLPNGYVALGYCLEFRVITATDADISPDYQDMWQRPAHLGPWICKYGATEPRIYLKRLNCAEISLLLRAFGIHATLDDRNCNPFRGSLAWDALVKWTARHPRLAKYWSARGSYVGDWYGDARAQIASDKRTA